LSTFSGDFSTGKNTRLRICDNRMWARIYLVAFGSNAMNKYTYGEGRMFVKIISRYNDYVTAWTIGVLGFVSRRGLRIFLFTTASKSALGPTSVPIQWLPRVPSLGIKRPECEVDHSPSSARAKECVELYLHSPNTPSVWCSVKKARGRLYLSRLPYRM